MPSSKKVKSNEKVTINGKARSVYVGQRGGRYIKEKGDFKRIQRGGDDNYNSTENVFTIEDGKIKAINKVIFYNNIHLALKTPFSQYLRLQDDKHIDNKHIEIAIYPIFENVDGETIKQITFKITFFEKFQENGTLMNEKIMEQINSFVEEQIKIPLMKDQLMQLFVVNSPEDTFTEVYVIYDITQPYM